MVGSKHGSQSAKKHVANCSFGKDSLATIAADEPSRLQRLGENQISLLDKYGKTEADALRIVEAEELLSPIYNFAPRNGCFFCPNARLEELRHLYDHHKDLWDRMLCLQAVPNKATERFNRTQKFSDIDREFRMMDAKPA